MNNNKKKINKLNYIKKSIDPVVTTGFKISLWRYSNAN